jgi:hypothetical protein
MSSISLLFYRIIQNFTVIFMSFRKGGYSISLIYPIKFYLFTFLQLVL